MHLFKNPKSQFWQAQIWIDGEPHKKSTRRTNKEDARKAAKQIEADLRAQIAAEAAIGTGTSLALGDLFVAYFDAVGIGHVGSDDTFRVLNLIHEHPSFARAKLITQVTHADVVALRDWRRSHTIKTTGRPISAYTVNDTIEQLKKVFNWFKRINRRVVFETEPNWSDKTLKLTEPRAHVRQLSATEDNLIDDLRTDYLPLVYFSLICGQRKTNCFTLTWSQVKWDASLIEMMGKGAGGGTKRITVKINPEIRALLWPLWQGRQENCGVPQAAERVFTFVAERTLDKVIKGRRHMFVAGKRYPITKDGLRRTWNTWRDRHGLRHGADRLRWHDLRHDFASKFLAHTNNGTSGMKQLQELLHHERLATTMDLYAHLQPGQADASAAAVAHARFAERLESRKNPPTFPPTQPLKVVKGR